MQITIHYDSVYIHNLNTNNYSLWQWLTYKHGGCLHSGSGCDVRCRSSIAVSIGSRLVYNFIYVLINIYFVVKYWLVVFVMFLSQFKLFHLELSRRFNYFVQKCLGTFLSTKAHSAAHSSILRICLKTVQNFLKLFSRYEKCSKYIISKEYFPMIEDIHKASERKNIKSCHEYHLLMLKKLLGNNKLQTKHQYIISPLKPHLT